LTIIVDVANVMGARADGWWKDRAAAARRLRREVSALAERGLAVTDLPREALAERRADERCFPSWVLVLEGKARAAASDDDASPASAGPARGEVGAEESYGSRQIPADAVPLVRLVLAPGSGDDTLAELAADLGGRRIAVTADRELRRRCEQAGAVVTGPRWLLELL
jgi:hypothetical protein